MNPIIENLAKQLGKQFRIKKLGLEIRGVKSYRVDTPFLNYINDSFVFYIYEINNKFEFNDDSWSLEEWTNSKVGKLNDGLVCLPTEISNKIDSLVKNYNVKITNTDNLSKIVKKNKNILEDFNQYLQCLIALDSELRLEF